MNPGWAGLCIALLAATSCEASSSGAAVEGEYAGVSEMVSVLEGDGISCRNLQVFDKEELSRIHS